MGPLVSAEQLDRVKGFIDDGVRQGARVRAGGEAPDGPGYFVRPTVLTDVRPDMRVVREEIFGPVVSVQTFRDDAGLREIAATANDTPYGLAASIWTADLARAHVLAAMIDAGTVWINCHNIFDPALPFGGFKQSGWGREMGEEVLAHYTEIKSIVAAL
jgi:phenylacetaldehyde dehydrogenase